MNNLTEGLSLTSIPVAEAGMLVRKPAHIVYEAFIDPSITTKFWFTRSSGKLEADKRVRWDWEMYGASTLVDVKELEPDRRILVEWGVEDKRTCVEWVFSALTPETTFVSIKISGFTGSADEIVAQAVDLAAGFALVLAGLKAFLEYGIELQLIADRFPEHHDGIAETPNHEE